MGKIVKVYLTPEQIVGVTDDGRELSQSLLWYRQLLEAPDEVRNDFSFGASGIFWNQVDVQISFESFEYPDAQPTKLQRFFLTHQEINVSGFAKRFGLNPTLLRSYINGFKTPSPAREEEILAHIRALGDEYISY